MAVNGIAATQAAEKQSQTVVGVSGHLEVWCSRRVGSDWGGGGRGGTGGFICIFFKVTLFNNFIGFKS